MKKVTFSPAAAADLDTIWDYTIEKWGLAQAEQYTDNIENICNELANGLRQGRNVSIRADYLKYAVGRHFIYFREEKELIEIVRILHQRMDVERQFHA